MTAHAITLSLPESLYQRFRQRAEWMHRSLENELLDALTSAVSTEEDQHLPELIAAIGALENLDDDELWRLARDVVSRQASQELESLHFKQEDEGLSQSEDAIRAELMRESERKMLIRAQAAKLLKERGHDISGLLTTP